MPSKFLRESIIYSGFAKLVFVSYDFFSPRWGPMSSGVWVEVSVGPSGFVSMSAVLSSVGVHVKAMIPSFTCSIMKLIRIIICFTALVLPENFVHRVIRL